MKSRLFISLLLLTFSFDGYAQTDTDEQLAAQYFKNGEYEKAEVYYKKLYKKSNDEFFFRYYVDCLLKLEDFDGAEKTVEKRIKKEADVVLYLVLSSTRLYIYSGDPDTIQYR